MECRSFEQPDALILCKWKGERSDGRRSEGGRRRSEGERWKGFLETEGGGGGRKTGRGGGGRETEGGWEGVEVEERRERVEMGEGREGVEVEVGREGVAVEVGTELENVEVSTLSHGKGGLNNKETGRDINFAFFLSPFFILSLTCICSLHNCSLYQPSGGIPTPVHP